MQLVEHSLFPAAATPVDVMPLESRWVDNFTGAVNIARLKARGRIRNVLSAVDLKRILCSCFNFSSCDFKPSSLAAVQSYALRLIVIAKADFNLTRCRSPKSKTNALIFVLGAERHFMTALHSTLPSYRFHHCHGAPSALPSNALAVDKLFRHRPCRSCANHFPEMCPSMRSNGRPD